MSDTKLREALRFLSIAATAAAFAALTLINHKGTIAPLIENGGLVYNLNEANVLALIIAASAFAGIVTEEIANMLLGKSMMKRAEAAQAKAEAAQAKAEAAEEKAAAEVERERTAREAAEARAAALEAQLANGAKPQPSENGANGNSETIIAVLNYLAAERDKDRELMREFFINERAKEDAGAQR